MIEINEFSSIPVTPTLRAIFGEAFHVGLRKAIDSRHSVIAWNAIHLVPDPIYRAFSDYVFDAMCHISRLELSSFQRILRSWNSQYYLARQPPDVVRKLNMPAIHIFDAAMNSIPDTDIEHLLLWLEECVCVRDNGYRPTRSLLTMRSGGT